MWIRPTSIPACSTSVKDWHMQTIASYKRLKMPSAFYKPKWQVTEISRMKQSRGKRQYSVYSDNMCQTPPGVSLCLFSHEEYIYFSVSPVKRCWHFPVLAFLSILLRRLNDLVFYEPRLRKLKLSCASLYVYSSRMNEWPSLLWAQTKMPEY